MKMTVNLVISSIRVYWCSQQLQKFLWWWCIVSKTFAGNWHVM